MDGSFAVALAVAVASVAWSAELGKCLAPEPKLEAGALAHA